MAYAMGGRVAEEIVFHDPSTGASNDIEKATDTARKMVTQYGMSERVGSVKLGSGTAPSRSSAGTPPARAATTPTHLAAIVDEEVRALIDAAHDEAYAVLTENRHVLDRLALELLEHETLNQTEIAEVFHDIGKRPRRKVWLSKDTRPVHSRGSRPRRSSGASRRERGPRGRGGHADVVVDPGSAPSLPAAVPGPTAATTAASAPPADPELPAEAAAGPGRRGSEA